MYPGTPQMHLSTPSNGPLNHPKAETLQYTRINFGSIFQNPQKRIQPAASFSAIAEHNKPCSLGNVKRLPSTISLHMR